jgi:STE24 endopeptidase
MEGVLVHELGHHLTRATRFTLIAVWLATPWRLASRLMIGIGLATVGRHQRRPLLALVTVAVVAIAVVQSVQQHETAAAVLLATLLVCGVACPLADAWVARRSEFAAVRFAADRGTGRQLAAALRNLDPGYRDRHTWTQRALSRHPSAQCRIRAISNYTP